MRQERHRQVANQSQIAYSQKKGREVEYIAASILLPAPDNSTTGLEQARMSLSEPGGAIDKKRPPPPTV